MQRLDTSNFCTYVTGDQAEPSALSLAILAQEILDQGEIQATKVHKRIDFLLHELMASLPAMSDPVEYVSALNDFLFRQKKFEVCTEDSKEVNHLLISRVLENRKGASISLSLIYRDLLQRCQSSPVNLINFPGSFFIKILYRHQLYFLDPSDSGRLLTISDLQKNLSIKFGKNVFLNGTFLETPTEMQTITRFLSKLKLIYSETRRWTLLLATLDMLIAANPTRMSEYKERGLLLLQLNSPLQAYDDLVYYVRRSRPSPELEHIKMLVKQIEGPNNVTPLF